MANGASGSSLVALIKAHTRGRSSGRGCDDVGHISTSPEPAISTFTEQVEGQHVRTQARHHEQSSNGRVHGRHRTAQEDAASDKCHRGQHGQRPAQPIRVVPFRIVVVAGEYRDQPACGADQRQRTETAGDERIDVNDNAFARAKPW